MLKSDGVSSVHNALNALLYCEWYYKNQVVVRHGVMSSKINDHWKNHCFPLK